MLENIEIFINYSNFNINELFGILSRNENFSELLFIDKIYIGLKGNCDFVTVFTECLNNRGIMCNFDNEDIELFKGFFRGLGQSDVSGQILNCKTYKEFFKQKLSKLETNEKNECKSRAAITIGFGLFFSILII